MKSSPLHKVPSGSESLEMSLSHRLVGSLEDSSVEMVEQLVSLFGRCEVVEEALVEEYVAMENKVEGKIDGVEKSFRKVYEEKVMENIAHKNKLAKLEEEHINEKKNFLQLVETCERMEEKINGM